MGKWGLEEKPVEYPRLPADMDYRFFENFRRAPFAPGGTRFSTATAWWLAEFSHLAYTLPGFARMALKLAGFPGFRFWAGQRTGCMFAWNRRCLVVAFRGTERGSRSVLYDIITDLSILPRDFPGEGRVHGGFLDAFFEVWRGEEGLEEFLVSMASIRRRKIWITGHSLGGALGNLCFSCLGEATGLYTFGAPRVGDDEYAKLTLERPYYRVEHARDPVPLLPPDTPGLNFHYAPQGTLVHISREGDLLPHRPKPEDRAEREPVEDLRGAIGDFVREARDSIEDYFEQHRLSVRDHMPILYSAKLWNAFVRGHYHISAESTPPITMLQ